MTASDFRFGFRIVGKTCEPRRPVDAGAAFAAHAACDPRAECGREAYLSAFRFAADFADHLKTTDSTAGFSGPCWSPWLWWDLDSDELQYAHKDAGALAAFLVERYAVEPGELLLFFSGRKGFHVGLPTALWSPPPSADFHRTARHFAENVAALAVVTIDTGVYDRVQAFRAPNSRHPKTGLHKRRLTMDELLGPLDAILELATKPAPFTVPQGPHPNPLPEGEGTKRAAADWQAAAALVTSEGEAKAARRAAGNGAPTLNRSTLDYIRNGADQGDRHRLLFSAAANLREFGCTPALAVALLEESALDSGLAPKDVRRQIECGLKMEGGGRKAEGGGPTQQAAPESTQDTLDGSTVKKLPDAAASDSGGLAGQSCQQVTGAMAADLQAALARLWGASEGGGRKAEGGRMEDPHPDPLPKGEGTKTLPPDPPPLLPLPPGAVGSGTLDKPCRCGSTEYVDVAISEGRTRRDCRKCGRFAGFGKWYDQGGIG